MKRTLVAVLVAFGAALLAVSTSFAWQTRVDGKPVSFSAGSTSGVYIWHNLPVGMSVRTTNPQGVEHHYTGTITTDGTFIDLSPVQLDGSDSVTVDGTGHYLTFDFHTYSGVDGVDFEVRGGTGIRASLQVDSVNLDSANVFLGAFSVHPDFNPLLICREETSICNGRVPAIP